MYCIECGAENLDRAKFCMECGQRMPIPGQRPAEPEAAAPPAETAPEAEKVEETPTPSEDEQQEQQEEEEEEEEEEAESEEEAASDEEAKEEEPPAGEEVKQEAPPESQIPTLRLAKEDVSADQETGEGEGDEKEEEEKKEEQPGEAITMLPASIPVGIAVKPAAPEVPQGIPVAPAPEPGPGEEKVEEGEKAEEEAKDEEAQITQPTLPQAPSAAPESGPPPWPPARPRSMKVLGVLCIIAGVLNALINVVAAMILIVKLSSIRGAQVPLIVHPTVSLFWIALACILFVGGIGMVRARLWGRKLCLFFGYSVIPLMVVSGVAVKTADVVASVGGLSQSYNLLVAAGLFYPALMVVLLMALLTGRIKRWAELVEAGPGVVPPAQPEPSMPAVFCLLTSLAPPFALYSLILGLVGLRQIRRSGGRKCGRGKAIAGLVISGLVLLTVLTGIGLAIGIAVAKG